MTMSKEILGIHHVTAIAGDPQRNLDFYTGVLGLRLLPGGELLLQMLAAALGFGTITRRW